MSPGRYLMVRLSAIGDVVFGLEALAAIREVEPDAEVDWLVEDRIRGLLEEHPALRHVIAFPRKDFSRRLSRPWLWPSLAVRLWRFVRRLRREEYDAVLDLHGNLKSGLQVLCTRAKRKIGYGRGRAKEASWRFVHERVDVPSPRPHRAEEGLLLVRRLYGREVPRPSCALLPPTSTERARRATRRAEEILAALPANDGVVILAPGTSAFAKFKRWPADRFAALAEALRRDNFAVVITSGPGEEQLALAARGQSGAHWLDGAREGLDVTLEVMRLARLCVAADSGPLHLAQAVGIPVVGLFGPKDPSVYGPRRTGSIVLRYSTPCSPCGRRRCDLPSCVRAIPSETVHRAVRDVLRGHEVVA